MILNSILDKFVSILIVYTFYSLSIFFWYYIYYSFGYHVNFILFYFPYGIILLAFLFFGNKIIFGIIFSHITLFYVVKIYNLDLPFDNFFALSACQLVSVPLTLFVLQKLNFTMGTGRNDKFNKTNIFHVLLIIFYSTIILGIIIFFSSLFLENLTNLLNFTIGNLFGGSILIILMKILINIPNILTSLIKSN